MSQPIAAITIISKGLTSIETGSAPCPPVIGVTLGGGAGRYQGTYGLMIDALVSARLVTAQGEMVEVSKTENPDLFWAIRGAGANFGIVDRKSVV